MRLKQSWIAQLKDYPGWRTVPIDNQCLGPIAVEQQPRIEQIFVAPQAEQDQLQLEATCL